MLYVSPEFRYARTDDCNWCLRPMIINRIAIAFGTLELRTTFALILFSLTYMLSLCIFYFLSTKIYSLSCNKPHISFRRLFIRRSILVPCCREILLTGALLRLTGDSLAEIQAI